MSDNVRAEITRAGKTYTQVRELIGMSRGAWHRRMNDPGAWTVGELNALASVLHVPLRKLTDPNGDLAGAGR